MNEIKQGAELLIGDTNVTVEKIDRVNAIDTLVFVDFYAKDGARWSLMIRTRNGVIEGKRSLGWGSGIGAPYDPVEILTPATV